MDRAQIVILAAPVRAIERIGEAVAASIPPGAFVTDVGSTKREIVAALDPLWPGRFVGGHPIAGTEHSGPEAADPALFEGRRVVLVRTERTGPDALASIDAMWRSIGVARVDVHEPAEHDRIFAAVSHLPHVAAFAICSALSDLPERELGAIEGFALAGFKDTTRIAGSDPRMWCDIFESNRDEVLRLVEILRERLGSLAGAIRAQDQEAVLMEIERARTMRRRVVGK